MENVRLRLGEPRANKPGYALLLQQVSSHTRTVKRHKQNTGNAWDYNDVEIDVEQDEDTYLINRPDFGTPLVLITRDDSNPQHIVRVIDYYAPQNIFYNYSLPGNIGSYVVNLDGSFHSAMRYTVFRKSNQVYLQILPKPALACTYVLRYVLSANGVDGMALTQDPVEAADADLIEIRSAKSLLSNSEWMAGDSVEGRAYNADKRKELIVTLRDDEALAQRQFEAAQLIQVGPRVHTRYDFTTG